MNPKKVLQKSSLAYTSNANYSKPPKTPNPHLQCLGTPHIDSFNYMLHEGLNAAIADLIPAEFQIPGYEDQKVKISIDKAVFAKPTVPVETVGVKTHYVWPTECRQRAATYKGEFKIWLNFNIANKMHIALEMPLGYLPIMLKSKVCHLADLTPEELVQNNEHSDECGGYFIVKGHQCIARMLLVTRRNYPLAMKRPSWRMRDELFTEYGVLVRCVKEDQTSTNNVLHFLQNGTCKLMFSHCKMMYFTPLVLIMKCLVDWPDHYIYRLLLHGKKNDQYYDNCIRNMLRKLHEEGFHTTEDCRSYLGRMFRPKLSDLPPWTTDLEAADFLLTRCVMIHLRNYTDKFYALVYMAQKLYDMVQNKCKVEGADAVMCQELLVGGHLYLQVLKERLQNILYVIKASMIERFKPEGKIFVKDIYEIVRVAVAGGNLGQTMETFLSTGNAPTNNVRLPQYKGLTIVDENINRMRYMSHSKAIHRGSFFMKMRTTEARQLLPDASGFVCPVHTPDGAPCGLLNHLTASAQVTQTPDPKQVKALPFVLERCGMEPIRSVADTPLSHDVYKYPVFIDGRLAGYLPEDIAAKSTAYLRTLKGKDIPIATEIVLIPKKQICAQYAGMFLFTSEARMIRPVINLATGQLELIGDMEQLYLDIAVIKTEIIPGITTHLEQSAFMSNLAQLVPMPDCNPSPRVSDASHNKSKQDSDKDEDHVSESHSEAETVHDKQKYKERQRKKHAVYGEIENGNTNNHTNKTIKSEPSSDFDMPKTKKSTKHDETSSSRNHDESLQELYHNLRVKQKQVTFVEPTPMKRKKKKKAKEEPKESEEEQDLCMPLKDGIDIEEHNLDSSCLVNRDHSVISEIESNKKKEKKKREKLSMDYETSEILEDSENSHKAKKKKKKHKQIQNATSDDDNFKHDIENGNTNNHTNKTIKSEPSSDFDMPKTKKSTKHLFIYFFFFYLFIYLFIY